MLKTVPLPFSCRPATRPPSPPPSRTPQTHARDRLGLSIRGKDYEYDGSDAALPHAPYPMKGVGPFTHADARDRPPEIFAGITTLHFPARPAPYLLLPIIPDCS